MPGARVSFGNGLLKAEIIDKMEGGNRKVKFEYDGIFNEILDIYDSYGAMLPGSYKKLCNISINQIPAIKLQELQK